MVRRMVVGSALPRACTTMLFESSQEGTLFVLLPGPACRQAALALIPLQAHPWLRI